MPSDCLEGAPFRRLSNFFSEPILVSLLDVIRASTVRRLEYSISGDSGVRPSEPIILDAALYASNKLGLSFNHAILKWYKKSDEYKSDAYNPHIDPPEFRSIPLVLITLYGDARLTVWLSDGTQQDVLVCGNDAVVLSPHLLHQVSEPLGDDGTRYYMFLGFKQGANS